MQEIPQVTYQDYEELPNRRIQKFVPSPRPETYPQMSPQYPHYEQQMLQKQQSYNMMSPYGPPQVPYPQPQAMQYSRPIDNDMYLSPPNELQDMMGSMMQDYKDPTQMYEEKRRQMPMMPPQQMMAQSYQRPMYPPGLVAPQYNQQAMFFNQQQMDQQNYRQVHFIQPPNQGPAFKSLLEDELFGTDKMDFRITPNDPLDDYDANVIYNMIGNKRQQMYVNQQHPRTPTFVTPPVCPNVSPMPSPSHTPHIIPTTPTKESGNDPRMTFGR